MSRLLKTFVAAVLFALGAGQSAFGCATCYGASSDPMAQGMNWGIMTLLVVIMGVLCAVVTFFIYIARRAAAMDAATLKSLQPETKQ